MQTLRILKTLERAWPFRKQASNFINVIRRFAKKYWKSLVYHYQCNWNLQMSDFFFFFGKRKTGVPGEKPLGARERTSNKLSPHMESTLGFEPGPHWWEASVLTTAPKTNFNILVYHSVWYWLMNEGLFFSGRIMKRRTYLLFVATFCMAYCCK